MVAGVLEAVVLPVDHLPVALPQVDHLQVAGHPPGDHLPVVGSQVDHLQAAPQVDHLPVAVIGASLQGLPEQAWKVQRYRDEAASDKRC